MTTDFKLKKKENFNCNAKFLIVVLDGVGFTDSKSNINFSLHNDSDILPGAAFHAGNAVNASYTPNLFKLYTSPLFRTLKAHGKAVGLPSDDDMGNSEVGHNALGSGRIFAQGAKLVNAALLNESLFKGQTWQNVVCRQELLSGTNTLHLCGLLSDGNVHSHIDHLFALIQGAKVSGVQKVRLHMLLDGRDVSPLSSLEYVKQLENFLAQTNDSLFDCQIASGGGRTFVTMDRYESDWKIVERGYHAHVLGLARPFANITAAIETYRAESNFFDQDLPPFVIHKDDKPLGIIEDNDSFILFNFRGDRAIQISRALTEEHFNAFERIRFPKVHYAGMMQYDGDLKIPAQYLVEPPRIENTMTELLSAQNVSQFACSETQKYGHVTYFWNGNRSEKFNEELEHYVEIPSDTTPFAQKPWMKSAEIADETIKQMENNSFKIGRINFANGDMIGHTGDFAAAILAMGATDLALGRIMQSAKLTNTVLLVTADHGNADEMYEIDKKTKKIAYDALGNPRPKTSHTLAPVPFALYNAEALDFDVEFQNHLPNAGLANIASTVLDLAGFEPPAFYEPSLVSISLDKKNAPLNEKEKISPPRFSLLEKAIFNKALPSLNFAVNVSKSAQEVGFFWPTLTDVFKNIQNEVEELRQEIESKNLNIEKVYDEIGDIVFSLAHVVQFLTNSPEGKKSTALTSDFDLIVRKGVDKFVCRFHEMEKIMYDQKNPLTSQLAKSFHLDQWEKLWNEAKKKCLSSLVKKT